MNPPSSLQACFPASSDRLLNLSRAQIDDGMLREIADADYGIDGDAHFAALLPIRDQGTIPVPMGWHPGEVLRLMRWSNPEDPNHQPGGRGPRGHQMRAFSCAVLLRSAFENGEEAEEATLAQCLASAKTLGDEMSNAAARFIVWCLPFVSSRDRWLFALGLLLLATRLRAGRISDHALSDISAWVLAEESESRLGYDPSDPPPEAFGMTFGCWKPLVAELIANAADIDSIDVREDVEFIGAMLVEES